MVHKNSKNLSDKQKDSHDLDDSKSKNYANKKTGIVRSFLSKHNDDFSALAAITSVIALGVSAIFSWHFHEENVKVQKDLKNIETSLTTSESIVDFTSNFNDDNINRSVALLAIDQNLSESKYDHDLKKMILKYRFTEELLNTIINSLEDFAGLSGTEYLLNQIQSSSKGAVPILPDLMTGIYSNENFRDFTSINERDLITGFDINREDESKRAEYYLTVFHNIKHLDKIIDIQLTTADRIDALLSKNFDANSEKLENKDISELLTVSGYEEIAKNFRKTEDNECDKIHEKSNESIYDSGKNLSFKCRTQKNISNFESSLSQYILSTSDKKTNFNNFNYFTSKQILNDWMAKKILHKLTRSKDKTIVKIFLDKSYSLKTLKDGDNDDDSMQTSLEFQYENPYKFLSSVKKFIDKSYSLKTSKFQYGNLYKFLTNSNEEKQDELRKINSLYFFPQITVKKSHFDQCQKNGSLSSIVVLYKGNNERINNDRRKKLNNLTGILEEYLPNNTEIQTQFEIVEANDIQGDIQYPHVEVFLTLHPKSFPIIESDRCKSIHNRDS